jgi:plastocyanin
MPTQLEKTAGDNTVGAAGQPLTALVVTVLDASNAPVAGVTVTWAAASGGGSVAPATGTTGGDGKASATRTLGPTAGTQTTTATVTGLAPVTFSHVAQIQGATQIQVQGSAARPDTVLATVPALVARVSDQNSAPVAGVIVTWSVQGGGQITQAVDTTDASGLTSVTWTLGSAAGTQTVLATVTGLIGSPATFSSAAAAGNAATLTLNGGNGQAGPVGDTLPVQHSVIVRDAHGNGKAGVAVAWKLGDGGGGISPLSGATTNGSGIAGVSRILGANPGPSSDTASVAALAGSPIVFTDTAGPVANVTVGNNFFSPAKDTVAAGTFMRFTWSPGGVSHSVVWLTGPVPLPANSVVQSQGKYVARLIGAGTYTYECGVHGAIMSGSIVAQ